jgi:hypothetical protein
MSVDVKVIKKIDKRDYPKWLNEDPKRQAYEITINGKKTYAYWANPKNSMLYVDGYCSDLKPYIQGWDVRSALTSSRDYESLFGDSMINVDEAIDKVIKHWELTKGLKDGAKEAWSDILEFKQIVLEALNDLDIEVIGVAESNWGIKESGSIIYDVNINNVPTTVEFLPGGSGDSDWLNIRLINGKSWGNAGNLYKLLHLNDNLHLQDLTLSIERAIKHYNLTKGLKKGAKEAWSNILESKSAPPIKVIREANTRELAEADDYFLRGGQGMLVKPIDKGWIVNCKGAEYRIFPNYVNHMQDYIDDQDFVMFTKHGRWINYSTDRVPTNILQNSELKKAINHYELTKGLKKGAKEAWKDILS